jgi:hypothetical protein
VTHMYAGLLFYFRDLTCVLCTTHTYTHTHMHTHTHTHTHIHTHTHTHTHTGQATPLHAAAQLDEVECGRLLVQWGADVEAVDVAGDTPRVRSTRHMTEPQRHMIEAHTCANGACKERWQRQRMVCMESGGIAMRCRLDSVPCHVSRTIVTGLR